MKFNLNFIDVTLIHIYTMYLKPSRPLHAIQEDEILQEGKDKELGWGQIVSRPSCIVDVVLSVCHLRHRRTSYLGIT